MLWIVPDEKYLREWNNFINGWWKSNRYFIDLYYKLIYRLMLLICYRN